MKYSEEYYKNRVKPFYTIGESEMDTIRYEQISSPPRTNIYTMKRFPDNTLSSLHSKGLSENQKRYSNSGYLILRNFIPEEIIEDYIKLRDKLGLGVNEFSDVTPFIEHPEVRALTAYPPLLAVLAELHSSEMGLIFTLTKFLSTERGWHQDAYLDRNDAIPRVAVWFALGSIDKSGGPFEFIPGSHQWDALDNQKINRYLKEEYRWPAAHRNRVPGAPGWGRIAEAFVDPAVNRHMEELGLSYKPFVANQGDVLIWYGRLMHRGSPPSEPGTVRPAIIGHYAPIFERERGLFAKVADHSYVIAPPHKAHHLL